ncbi:hypothetical protein LNP26_19175 [Klebsiella variicola subsp. variicola]|nr:hypothetical protein [Klebsiella variicola subsp. variicola]
MQALRLQRQGRRVSGVPAARLAVVCAMNWRNTRSPKGHCPLLPVSLPAVEYLLVAVLNNPEQYARQRGAGYPLDHYLDINHADIVARIDLTGVGNQPGVDPLSDLPERAGRAQSGRFLYGFPRRQRRA